MSGPTQGTRDEAIAAHMSCYKRSATAGNWYQEIPTKNLRLYGKPLASYTT